MILKFQNEKEKDVFRFVTSTGQWNSSESHEENNLKPSDSALRIHLSKTLPQNGKSFSVTDYRGSVWKGGPI